MITYIKIDGFKSFQKFEMAFTPLTIVAGINASGKSNLFDALMLLSKLAEADKLQSAFKEQRGDLVELFTRFDDQNSATEMEFVVEMLVDKKIKDSWGGKAELKYTRLRYELKLHRFINDSGLDDLEVISERLENLKHNDDKWIKLIPKNKIEIWRPKVDLGKRGVPYIFTEQINGISTVIVPQDGTGGKRHFPLKNASKTVLSSFDTVDFRHILAAKEEMKSWRFLQLNPEDLRQPTNKKTMEDTISSSGQNLAAALFRIKQNDPYSLVELSRKINKFLPNFTDINVVDDKENKQFIIILRGEDGKEFTSKVLSEGTLRLLLFCILEYDEKFQGLICFEEPENGIHPFKMKSLANLLKNLTTDFVNTDYPLRQLLINTHSPKLLNEIKALENNQNVSVQFSQMRSKITEIGGVKKKINITKITPVILENSFQTNIPYSEQDQKFALSAINQYLQTEEFEIAQS